MTSHIQPLIQRLVHLASANPRVIATALASALVGIPILRIAAQDYREYLKIGPGGVPYNVFGWLIQLSLRPLKKETLHTGCYEEEWAVAQAGPNGHIGWLSEDDVPLRDGERPTVGSWTVPSRQLTELAGEDVKERYQTFLSSLASSSPLDLKIATSFAEGRGPALFIGDGVFWRYIHRRTRGEIAHMHESDGSMHVNLAPKDAKLVLERGWGERHPLSGRGLYVGMVMVYAPRGEAELEVVKGITRAAVRFMVGEGL
ncbi:hypothetical protein ACJZ2D_006960 [Fusarium nematophilum]